MKCPVCDSTRPGNGAFCQQCGAKLPQLEGLADPPTEAAADLRDEPQSGTDSSVRVATASDSHRHGRYIDVPEETLWEGSYTPKAMLGTFVLYGVATVVMLVIAVGFATGAMRMLLLGLIVVGWILAALQLASRRLGISYKLTNHMFYHRHGVLTRVTDRIELIEVHDVTWEQGLFERLVGVGRIKIASSDRTDPLFYVRGVENVETVAELIDKARRGEQVRRGRRIDFSHIDGET